MFPLIEKKFLIEINTTATKNTYKGNEHYNTSIDGKKYRKFDIQRAVILAGLQRGGTKKEILGRINDVLNKPDKINHDQREILTRFYPLIQEDDTLKDE